VNSGPLISLRGITRTFTVPDSPPLNILTGVDLDVHPGEHVAIVGRSGTGKSTLLNTLGLIDIPTSGSYHLTGIDTARLGEGRRAPPPGGAPRLRLPARPLISGLTTTENVAAPLLYDHGTAFWRRTSRAEELLDAVGLASKAGMAIGRLSGGEQQRVAIARALARRPRVILADEPTGALDVDTGAAVMELLEKQCRDNGAALILITHDLAVAGRAHTQYRLEHGVLTPISVSRRQAGSLEEFSEVQLAPVTNHAVAPAPGADAAGAAGAVGAAGGAR